MTSVKRSTWNRTNVSHINKCYGWMGDLQPNHWIVCIQNMLIKIILCNYIWRMTTHYFMLLHYANTIYYMKEVEAWELPYFDRIYLYRECPVSLTHLVVTLHYICRKPDSNPGHPTYPLNYLKKIVPWV
jgi:hypothetical protein